MNVRSAINPPNFNCLELSDDTLSTALSLMNNGVTSINCAFVSLLRPITLNEATIGSAVEAFNVREILLFGSASCVSTYARSNNSLVVTLLKINRLLVYCLSSKLSKVLWNSCETSHSKQVSTDNRVWNLKVPLVINMSDGEESLLNTSFFLYKLVVGRRFLLLFLCCFPFLNILLVVSLCCVIVSFTAL